MIRTQIARVSSLACLSACAVSLSGFLSGVQAQDLIQRHFTFPVEPAQREMVIQAGLGVFHADVTARSGARLCLAMNGLLPGRQAIVLKPMADAQLVIRHKGQGRLVDGWCAGIDLSAQAPGDDTPDLVMDVVRAQDMTSGQPQGAMREAVVLKWAYPPRAGGGFEYVVPAGADAVKSSAPNPNAIRVLSAAQSQDDYEELIAQTGTSAATAFIGALGVCAASGPACMPFAVATVTGYAIYTLTQQYQTTLPAKTAQRYIVPPEVDTTPPIQQLAGSTAYNEALCGDCNQSEVVQPGLGVEPGVRVSLPPVEGLAHYLDVRHNFADVGSYVMGFPPIMGSGGAYSPTFVMLDPDTYRSVRDPANPTVAPLGNLSFADARYIAISGAQTYNWQQNQPAINTLNLVVVEPSAPSLGQYRLKLDGSQVVLGRSYRPVCVAREGSSLKGWALLEQIGNVYSLFEPVSAVADAGGAASLFVQTHQWLNPTSIPTAACATAMVPSQVTAERGLRFRYALGAGSAPARVALGVDETVQGNFSNPNAIRQLVRYCWNASCSTPSGTTPFNTVLGQTSPTLGEPVYTVGVPSVPSPAGASHRVVESVQAYRASVGFLDVTLQYQDTDRITAALDRLSHDRLIFKYDRSAIGTHIHLNASNDWDSVLKWYSQPCEKAPGGASASCSWVHFIDENQTSVAYRFANPTARLANRQVAGARPLAWAKVYGPDATATAPFDGVITDFFYDNLARVSQVRLPTSAASVWDPQLQRWVLPASTATTATGGAKVLITYDAGVPAGLPADARAQGMVAAVDRWPSTHPADFSPAFRSGSPHLTTTEASRLVSCQDLRAQGGPVSSVAQPAGETVVVPKFTITAYLPLDMNTSGCGLNAFVPGSSTGVLSATSLVYTSPNAMYTMRSGMGDKAQSSGATDIRFDVLGTAVRSELGKVAGGAYSFPPGESLAAASTYAVLGQVTQEDFLARRPYAQGAVVSTIVGVDAMGRIHESVSPYGALTTFNYLHQMPVRLHRTTMPGVDDTSHQPEVVLNRSSHTADWVHLTSVANGWSVDNHDRYQPYSMEQAATLDALGRVQSTSWRDLLAGQVVDLLDYRGRLPIRSRHSGRYAYQYWDYPSGQLLGATANMLSDPTEAVGTAAGCDSDTCYPSLALLPDSKARILALRAFMDENAVSQVFEYRPWDLQPHKVYAFGRHGSVYRTEPMYNRFGAVQGYTTYEVLNSRIEQVETDTSRLIVQVEPHLQISNPTGNAVKAEQRVWMQSQAPYAAFARQEVVSEQQDLFNWRQTVRSGQSTASFNDVVLLEQYTASLKLDDPASSSALPQMVSALWLPLDPANPTKPGMTWYGSVIDEYAAATYTSSVGGTWSDDTNPKNYLQIKQFINPSMRTAGSEVIRCAAGTNCSSIYERWADTTLLYKSAAPRQLRSAYHRTSDGHTTTFGVDLKAGQSVQWTQGPQNSSPQYTWRNTLFVDGPTGVAYGVEAVDLGPTATERRYYGYASAASGVGQSVSISEQGMYGVGEEIHGEYPNQYVRTRSMYQDAPGLFPSNQPISNLQAAIGYLTAGGDPDKGPIDVTWQRYGDSGQANTPTLHSRQALGVNEQVANVALQTPSGAPGSTVQVKPADDRAHPRAEVVSQAGKRAYASSVRADVGLMSWTRDQTDTLQSDDAGRIVVQETEAKDLGLEWKQLVKITYQYNTAIAKQYNMPDQIDISSPSYFGADTMSMRITYDGEARPVDISARGRSGHSYDRIRGYLYRETGSPRLKTAHVGGPDVLTYLYDDADRLYGLDLKTESGQYKVFRYGYDLQSQVVSVKQWAADSDAARSLTRRQTLVTQVSKGGAWDPFPSATYELDRDGNRLNLGGPMLTGNRPSFGGKVSYNALSAVSLDEKYAYEHDEFGRLVALGARDGSNRQYAVTYDGQGRVSAVMATAGDYRVTQRNFFYMGASDVVLGYVSLLLDFSDWRQTKVTPQYFLACIPSAVEAGCIGLLKNTTTDPWLNYLDANGATLGQRKKGDHTVGMKFYYAYGMQAQVQDLHKHGELPSMLYPGLLTVDFDGPHGDAGTYLLTTRGALYRTDHMAWDRPVGYPTAPYMMQR